MPRNPKITRRELLGKSIRCAGAAAAAGFVGYAALRQPKAKEGMAMLWQLDPDKCIQCGNCATNCVLKSSAVKCIHAFAVCGYCDLCFAYFQPQLNQRNTGAENQLCPVGAIQRTFVEDPYYQYTIDQSLCVGCGKCVKGCNAFGNGSLFLQIVHGDMSFKEWLRSQGEEDVAAWSLFIELDSKGRPKSLSEMIEEAKKWLAKQTGVKPQGQGATSPPSSGSQIEVEMYPPDPIEQERIGQELARGRDLLRIYKSHRGQVPCCLNCNECSIAIACPAQAFRRVPADQPYLLRKPKGPAA
jgi:electron transport complex protein RnfB